MPIINSVYKGKKLLEELKSFAQEITSFEIDR